VGLTARTGYELTGAVTLVDLDTSAPVVFPVRYPSDGYPVVFGPVEALAGTPAPGAFTPSAGSKTPSGFTVILAEAPGLGNSVSVPYTVGP
jgi:hypothetical protein